MSNFSSILASLSGTGQTSSTPAPARPPIPKTTLTPASAAARPPSQSTQLSTSLKRKAEETCTGLPPKIQRSDVATPSTKSAGIVSAGSAKQQISRPAQDPQSRPSTSNIEVATNTGAQSNRPPPKGSFREILARAEAAKAKQSEFGHIKHKALEKPSRKERRVAQEAAAAAAAKAKDGQKQRNGTRVALHKQPRSGKELAQRPKKTAAELGYTGTMKPSSSQPAYKGTMKPSMSTTNRPTSRGPGGLPSETRAHEGRYRYASYSDEEDEDDDESDMEAAGFDELEQEEQQSLRAAKKEDEEALRQENEHRRQKAEKRKKLERLAAARRR